MQLAPIVLFVYNRPEHTRKTLRALAEAELSGSSDLVIFSDAPKDIEDTEQVKKVNEVRQLIRSQNWCGNVKIIEQQKNKGLANSIIDGVTSLIKEHERVIVLEDDIVVTKGFLKYMNEALDLYQSSESVMHISGYIYPYSKKIKLSNDTLFLKIYSCWGWATWKRAWNHFNPDLDFHLKLWKTPEEIKKFNIEGHSDCYLQLMNNKEKKIFSWAVKWYSSWLNTGGFSLFPKTSLVKNIGNDASGIHSMATNVFDGDTRDYIQVLQIDIIENLRIRKSIDLFYKHVYHHIQVSQKIKNIIKKIIFYRYWKKIIQPFS